MTEAQKRLRELRQRQSTERGKMAELSRVDELSDEQRSELDTIERGTPDLERSLRAATVTLETEESEQRAAGTAARAPEGDGEDRERAELRRKVRLSGYVGAALEQRSADGAEAEFNASMGIAGNRFPLELLAPSLEIRATTDADTTVMPSRWLDRLFADTAAMRLGITMESVAAGTASFPVTTAGASAAQRAAVDRCGGRCRLDDRRNRNEAAEERRPAAVLDRGLGANSGAGVGAHARPPYGVGGGR